MSIYIGNDLEDRLEALEVDVSLRKYNLKDRLKALETENALLKKNTMNTIRWYMKLIICQTYM